MPNVRNNGHDTNLCQNSVILTVVYKGHGLTNLKNDQILKLLSIINILDFFLIIIEAHFLLDIILPVGFLL